mgnify:CR=1 FL=1
MNAKQMRGFSKLYKVEKQLDNVYHLLAKQIGVSDSVFWTMYCLCEEDCTLTQNDIAENVGLPKQTINSAINNLVKDGYIHLEQKAIARNNKAVCLSEKGKDFCKRHMMPILLSEERAFERLSEKEQETYLALSVKVDTLMKECLTELLEEREE